MCLSCAADSAESSCGDDVGVADEDADVWDSSEDSSDCSVGSCCARDAESAEAAVSVESGDGCSFSASVVSDEYDAVVVSDDVSGDSEVDVSGVLGHDCGSLAEAKGYGLSFPLDSRVCIGSFSLAYLCVPCCERTRVLETEGQIYLRESREWYEPPGKWQMV